MSMFNKKILEGTNYEDKEMREVFEDDDTEKKYKKLVRV